MLTPLLLYLAFFTVLHVVAQGAITRHYHRAFKISRGVAAGILTIIGFTALAFSLDHWRDAFLFAQDYRDGGRDFWMWHGLLIVLAHMLSDFVWMAWGFLRERIVPRLDLVLHHAVGVGAFSYALWKEMGYAICLIAMASELMPVSTGIAGWSQHKADRRLHDWASTTRLRVLVWVRRPLWFGLAALTARPILLGEVEEGFVVAYGIAAVGFTTLIFLDKYWIAKCKV
jgi:hypothetical protein